MYLSPKPSFCYYGSPGIYSEFSKGILAGNLTRGEEYIATLEQRLANWIGTRRALALPRARLGLYLAVRHLIRPGQKVIMSPYTIVDVVNMVICAGGVPLFADIDGRTGNIDPRQVAELIDRDTGAILATHLQGLACDIEAISEICRARNIALIEDGAQCLGGRVGSRHVGTFGRIGVFSFSIKKNVNTLYGGFLVTDDDSLFQSINEELALFSLLSKSTIFRQVTKCLIGDLVALPPVFQLLTFRVLSYNLRRNQNTFDRLRQLETTMSSLTTLPDSYRRRITPLQARLALKQIDGIEADGQIRLGYAKAYNEGLADLSGIGLPPLREDGSHTYLTYPVQVPDRQRFLLHITNRRCDVGLPSYTNTASLPCFAGFSRPCPAAQRATERTVLLPTYPSYGSVAVDRLIDAIRMYFHKR